MNHKITRRVILAGTIGILATGPFVIRAFRKNKKLELGEDSFLREFRAKYEEALTFPRTYKPFIHEQLAQRPKDEIQKVLKLQKQYWSNYSKIDEAEFDFSFFDYNVKGEKEKGNFYMEAHVRFKYGYGMEIVGKNVDSQPIHWIFNLDAQVTLPAAKEMNLSSMMLSFFRAYTALPEMWGIGRVYAENTNIPENPLGFHGEGKYIALEARKSINIPPRVGEQCYRRTYFNVKTGMPDYEETQEIPDRYNKQYWDESVPLPPVENTYSIGEYIKYADVFLPTTWNTYYSDGKKSESLYSNIKIKFV
jgi:hypothetical protein